jgi:hypothetical protein
MTALLLATNANASEADCKAHTTDSGGFFSGTTWKTWESFPNVSPTEAFRRAYVYVAKQGWKIGQSDKELGLLSASLNDVVQLESAHEQPVNVLVEPEGKGSKVTVTFSSGSGVVGSGGDELVCKVLSAEYAP